LIECDMTENPLRTDLVEEAVRFDAGRWLLPQSPGLGVEVRREALGQFRCGSRT
jgi:L-alanine-DL-glutamate epimerase-like enolase superfamily enzyme